jgi:hypothetical protein
MGRTDHYDQADFFIYTNSSLVYFVFTYIIIIVEILRQNEGH